MSLYICESDYLAHYGVKGMKWGVRKQRRQARKDAKEFAIAKQYYGKGAGTRRKHIKATVEQRKKDYPDTYSKEFDKALESQDMAKATSKAKRQRAVNTAKAETAKTARGIVNGLSGNMVPIAATSAAIVGAIHFTGADRVLAEYGQRKLSDFRNAQEFKKKMNQAASKLKK